jgi:hypothetical protein
MNQIIEVPEISGEVKAKLMQGSVIMFVARIGYADEYQAPISRRRP